MAASGKKNPFLSGFLVGLFVGLALAVAVALLVTRNNPFVDKAATSTETGAPTAPAEAPKYEFYQALPEGEAPSSRPAETPASAAYFLQVGAFNNAADADEMKARLALMGFEAKILGVQEGDHLLHKLRLGPYKSLDELNSVRSRLTQNGVDTMLVRIGPKETQ